MHSDFKVNDVNVEELRKSMRRTKLEKLGLVLAPTTQSAPSTGTGTGTSDDEDEGSTPSGDNGDRSLASTLGGSSESIPQQTSSSFLIAALDGPGSLSDKDRGRKSLSAIHNNDGSGGVGVSTKVTNPSLSKSFTNSKKEELMKVINEAKQKLENVSQSYGFLFKVYFILFKYSPIEIGERDLYSLFSILSSQIQSNYFFVTPLLL